MIGQIKAQFKIKILEIPKVFTVFVVCCASSQHNRTISTTSNNKLFGNFQENAIKMAEPV